MNHRWYEEANCDAKVSLINEEGLRVVIWKVLLREEPKQIDENAWKVCICPPSKINVASKADRIFFFVPFKPEYNLYNQTENVDSTPKTVSGQQLFGSKQGETWVVILVHGGYFSIGVFKAGRMIHHKSCHRYVTRRKNGGRQSTKDKSGKRPQSAGANIRRFNEEKHRIEIEETLKRWHHEIRTADMIFIHAPGPVNRKLLFFEGSPLNDDDTTDQNNSIAGAIGDIGLTKKKRCICNVPFTTSRPNNTEVVRVFEQLATIEIECSSTTLPQTMTA